MVNLIVDVSRYLMILLIAVYTWLNFRYFSFRDEGKQKKICGRQNRCMFLIHFLAYGILWLKTEDERLIAFYAAQVIFFLCYIYVSRLFYRHVSRLLVGNMCMLLSVGFIILTRLSFDRALKQFIIVLAAAVITWIIPFFIDRVWQLSKIPWVYGVLGLILLGVVLITGINSFGAQLSIGIGGFTFQPSEFVKISFVFFVATMFYRSTKFVTVCITTLVAALHVLILVASRDLGSALIFFVTYVLMLFVATGKWAYLLGGAGAGAAASVLAYQLFDHVRARVLAWRNPKQGIPDYAVAVRHWNGRLVWHGTLPGDAGENTGSGKGFRVFCRIGGIGRNLCPLCAADLFRLFSAVYDDCKPYESSLLQTDCLWPGNGLYRPGVSDRGRRDEIYPLHRSDPSPDELRRKLCVQHIYSVRSHAGAVYFKTE